MSLIFCEIAFQEFSLVKNKCLDIISNILDIQRIEADVKNGWEEIFEFNGLQLLNFDQVKMATRGGGRALLQNLNNSLPRIVLHGSLQEIMKVVEAFEVRFSECIVYGFICEQIDRELQDCFRKYDWQLERRDLPADAQIIVNPFYTNDREKEIISIESLPGHTHMMDYNEKLRFGSCWQMYFSKVYYKYIPKPLFDSFLECEDNTILQHGLRRIRLYKNVMEFDLQESRTRQWSFRRTLGIDSIAHELTKSNNRIEPKDLPVMVTKKDCSVGDTRVIRFLDTSDKVVSKEKAYRKEISEYFNDGEAVIFRELLPC